MKSGWSRREFLGKTTTAAVVLGALRKKPWLPPQAHCQDAGSAKPANWSPALVSAPAPVFAPSRTKTRPRPCSNGLSRSGIDYFDTAVLVHAPRYRTAERKTARRIFQKSHAKKSL